MNVRATLVALSVATAASAETVYLKAGGKVQGEIVKDEPGSVVLEVGPGQVAIARDRILRIEGVRSPVGEFETRASRLASDDVPGWLALGRWATEQDLASLAQRAYAAALAADPANREVHAAMGHVEIDGRWLSFEDAQRARGLVELDGRWVSPAEREAILRERGNEEARRQAARESQARVREAEASASEAEAAARKAEAEANAATNGGIPIGLVGTSGGVRPRGGAQGRRGSHPRLCSEQPAGCGPTPRPQPSPAPTPSQSTSGIEPSRKTRPAEPAPAAKPSPRP
jgi:hypothetical protein